MKCCVVIFICFFRVLLEGITEDVRDFFSCFTFYFLLFVLSLRRFTSIIVDKLKEYKVAFRGLGEGRHTFNYTLDESFFDCFEATKGTAGNINVTVVIVKSSLLMEVKIDIQGTVIAVCDRCLGKVEVPIQGEMNLYVKQNVREVGNDDDYVVLAPDDDYLDLSSYIYETYMLHYPLRIVHEEGKCDPEMKKVLERYVTDEGHRPVDPRWDELRKLINN